MTREDALIVATAMCLAAVAVALLAAWGIL